MKTEKEIIENVKRIANNARYFSDSLDYGSALWEICKLCGMDDNEIGADFIEECIDPAPVAEPKRCCENREGEIMNYSKIVEEIEESLKGEVIFDNAEKVEIESILRKYFEGGLSPAPVDEICECGHSKIEHQDTVISPTGFCDICSCEKFTPRKEVERKEKEYRVRLTCQHSSGNQLWQGEVDGVERLNNLLSDINMRLLKLEGK
jgi:hypothetical protein